MNETAQLNVRCAADGDRPRLIRHAVDSFLQIYKIDRATRDDIIMAVGEALINAVEHAYGDEAHGSLELHAHLKDTDLEVEVKDDGRFLFRPSHEGRGFGLRIIKAIALRVEIDRTSGTTVRMLFNTRLSHEIA